MMRGCFLCICIALWLFAPEVWAAVGPSSISDDSGSLTASDVEPGDSAFVQAIKVTEDNDGNDLQVNSITIKNAATAPLADGNDVSKIEIWRAENAACTTNAALAGSTTDMAAFNSTSGVTITLTAHNTVPDNASRWFCVKVITKAGLTPGRRILSRFLSAAGIDPSGVGGTWAGGTPGDASVGTFVTKASGPSAVTDQTSAGQSILSGQTKLVQVIQVTDNTPDANDSAITLNSLVITNLGTAQFGADIDRLEVYKKTDATCDISPSDSGFNDMAVGVQNISGTPSSVTVTLIGSGAVVADDSPGVDYCIHARVTSTPGRTIRFSTTVTYTENSLPGATGPVSVAADKASTIEAEGFESGVVNAPGFVQPTLTLGASDIVVQNILATDQDANTTHVVIRSVTLNNLGTAVGTAGGDIASIQYGTCNNDTCTTFTPAGGTDTVTAPFTFPVTIDGNDITLTDGNSNPATSQSVRLGIRVTLAPTATPGRTVQFSTILNATESADFATAALAGGTSSIASGIGCEVIASEAGVGPATVAGGSTNNVVQTVKCQDNDANGQGITITSVTIDNLGTATLNDIVRIAVYKCDDKDCDGDINSSNLMGQQLNPSAFPVAIATTTNNVIPDDQTRWLGIVVDVSSTLGNTIQTQVKNIAVTEGTQSTTHAGPFDDDTPSTITSGNNQGCDVMADLNVGAGDIPQGSSALVQRLVCIDSDGDTNPVQITQVNVRNLGTAVGADISKIEIVRMDTNAVVGSTTNVANFGTSTGVNVTVAIPVPDDGSSELGVRVYVKETATAGRTIQLRTTLRHFEGGQGPFTKSTDDAISEEIIHASQQDTTPPTVQLTSPTGGETLIANSEFVITWTCTDPAPSAGFGPTAVKLFYSTDGGQTFPHVIANGTENDGSFPWTVPNITSQTVRLRIECSDLAGNSAHDQSLNFVVQHAEGPRLTATISATLAACTEGYQPITYTVVITNTSTIGFQPDNPANELEIPLPSGTTYVANSAKASRGTAAFNTGKIVWNGSLAPGASATITFQITTTQNSGKTISLRGMTFSDRDRDGTNEFSAATEEHALTVVQLGDVNGDGEINALDVRLVWLHTHGATTLKGVALQAADVDCDGHIRDGDGLFMARRALGLPTGSDNPAFAGHRVPTLGLFSWILSVLGVAVFLRAQKRSALVLVVLIGVAGMLTACMDPGLPSPPDGPAAFVESLLVRREVPEAFVDVKVQQLGAGGGAASIQGELSYDPTVIHVKSLQGRNGFEVVLQIIDNNSGKLYFVAVKPTRGGVSEGSIVRIALTPVGPSNSKTALSWGSKSLVGSDENKIVELSLGHGQVRIR